MSKREKIYLLDYFFDLKKFHIYGISGCWQSWFFKSALSQPFIFLTLKYKKEHFLGIKYLIFALFRQFNPLWFIKKSIFFKIGSLSTLWKFHIYGIFFLKYIIYSLTLMLFLIVNQHYLLFHILLHLLVLLLLYLSNYYSELTIFE